MKTTPQTPITELADIGQINDKPGQSIRIRLVEHGGEKKIDVRRFVQSTKYTGPTVKGFMLMPKAASRLAALLNQAAA